VIRRDQNSITKTALHWTPEDQRTLGDVWLKGS